MIFASLCIAEPGPISHAKLNVSPNEITLAPIRIRKWTGPDIIGRFLSRRMWKARTITSGGTVHHLEICTFSLRSADI
jgi:hypothetical protein